MEVKELWKPLLEYKGIEVSSIGRIRKAANKSRKERILTEFPKDRDGYYRCSVQRLDGTWTSQPVHRLVAKAFIPRTKNRDIVNHIDGNRTNNRIENLEWVTPKENVIHSFKFGSRKICKQVPKKTILTDFQVNQIGKLRELYTVNQIAKLFNIEYQSLKNIIHKKKQCERLDDQQPSIYTSVYEGSETIPDGSK
jgi:HNH endonuclease family protein|nr:MAG TPA: homing endonuclease [Crassvirales sp.]